MIRPLFFIFAGWCALIVLSQAARAGLLSPSPPPLAAYIVGYRVITTGTGLTVAVWYPAEGMEKPYTYAGGTVGRVVLNAPPLGGRRLPLILFSHGLTGGGIQSIYITETLARHGYVVAAPDHRDSVFGIDGFHLPHGVRWEHASFFDLQDWNSSSWIDRYHDMENVLDYLLATEPFKSRINHSEIGGVGHSLGGYTIAGMCGAWPQWTDKRIKAALLFSPFVQPYLLQHRIEHLDVPVMYQGSVRDSRITPTLLGKDGAYALSKAPKYLLELPTGGHLDWTNVLGKDEKNVAATLQNVPVAQVVTRYSIAFLDKYVQGIDAPLLVAPNPHLTIYRHQP